MIAPISKFGKNSKSHSHLLHWHDSAKHLEKQVFRKAPSSYLSIFCSSILGSTFKWCWLFPTGQLYSWTGLFPLCKIWSLLFSRTWIHLIFPKMRTHGLIPPLSLLLLHLISKCTIWLAFCTVVWSEFQWLGYKLPFPQQKCAEYPGITAQSHGQMCESWEASAGTIAMCSPCEANSLCLTLRDDVTASDQQGSADAG